MRRWHRLAGWVAVCAALVLAWPAHATLLLALSLKDLVGRADNIVVADVESVTADWTADHRRIVSTIELRVVESWKGTSAIGARLRVVQPGGTAGGVVMHVDGMPRFTPGERALLFLRGGAERAGVVGMAQGKRALRLDGSGRWWVGGGDRGGADFVRPRDAAAPPVIDIGPRDLDQARDEVRAQLGTHNTSIEAPGAQR